MGSKRVSNVGFSLTRTADQARGKGAGENGVCKKGSRSFGLRRKAPPAVRMTKYYCFLFNPVTIQRITWREPDHPIRTRSESLLDDLSPGGTHRWKHRRLARNHATDHFSPITNRAELRNPSVRKFSLLFWRQGGDDFLEARIPAQWVP